MSNEHLDICAKTQYTMSESIILCFQYKIFIDKIILLVFSGYIYLINIPGEKKIGKERTRKNVYKISGKIIFRVIKKKCGISNKNEISSKKKKRC